MTTRALIDDFISHIADMPDAVLKDIHSSYRKWTMHYNPANNVLEVTCVGFGANQKFTYDLKRQDELAFIFDRDLNVVDGMSGENWFLSWRDGPDLEITGLEELL